MSSRFRKQGLNPQQLLRFQKDLAEVGTLNVETFDELRRWSVYRPSGYNGLHQRRFDLLPEPVIGLDACNQLAVDQEAWGASHPGLEPIRQVLLDLIAVLCVTQAVRWYFP